MEQPGEWPRGIRTAAHSGAQAPQSSRQAPREGSASGASRVPPWICRSAARTTAGQAATKSERPRAQHQQLNQARFSGGVCVCVWVGVCVAEAGKRSMLVLTVSHAHIRRTIARAERGPREAGGRPTRHRARVGSRAGERKAAGGQAAAGIEAGCLQGCGPSVNSTCGCSVGARPIVWRPRRRKRPSGQGQGRGSTAHRRAGVSGLT